MGRQKADGIFISRSPFFPLKCHLGDFRFEYGNSLTKHVKSNRTEIVREV